MYTPPQDCLDTLLGSKNVPTKFLFGFPAFGLKEKREKSIKKIQTSKSLANTHPTSYLYVIEDGHLAGITDSANSSTTHLDLISPSQPLKSDRLSGVEIQPPRDGPIIRRALSLTFSTQPRDELPMYRSATVTAMQQRALPSLPPTSSEASTSIAESVRAAAMLPYADEFARYTPPGQAPASQAFPQQLQHCGPESSNIFDGPISPRPTLKRSLTPKRSFEDPRKAPQPPRRTQSQRIQTLVTPPPSPPAITRHLSVKSAQISHRPAQGKISKFVELLDEPTKPASFGPSPPVSPFDMEFIPTSFYAPRELILPPPSPDTPHISFAPVQTNIPTKHLRVDSALGSMASHRSAQSSAINSARSSMEQRASSEMHNLLGSKAASSIVQSKGFMPSSLSRTSSKLSKRGLRRQQSLPKIVPVPYVRSSTPAEDYMMSGGLAPLRTASISTNSSTSDRPQTSSNVSRTSSMSSVHAEWPVTDATKFEVKQTLLPGVLPRRSASIASSRPISTLSQIPFVCTAEVLPVGLKSPVIAQGSAKLVSF